MIEFNEDPGPFYLDIEEYIQVGVISRQGLVLTVVNTCGGHERITVIVCIVNDLGAKLAIHIAAGYAEDEIMLYKEG
jgi:hypothetical protein